MAHLTWNDTYSVGVRSLDDQHTILFEALNDLHSAMMKGQGKTLTCQLLQDLAAYTRDHFTAEETILSIAKYPALPQHRIKHRDLITQVNEYITRFEQGDITLNIQLLNFLRDWLTNHIQKEDRQYASWLNECGIF
jgi:hemerythrin-like metal-binding protein